MPPRLVLILLLSGLSSASAQEARPLLVVLNKAEATASLVDPASGATLALVPTGVGPHEVAVSPDGRRAVVTDYGDQTTVGGTLTVIDLATGTVERTLSTSAYERPHGIAFLPDGRLAVTAERDSAVVLVDLDEGVVGAAPTGQAASHMLALAPDGRHAYAANIASGTVSRVDLTGGAPAAIAEVGPYAEAVAVRPGTDEVWAASQQTGRVVVLDGETLAARGELTVTGRPIRILFTPDGRRALITSVESSTLHVVDAETRALVGSVALPLGDRANAAAAGGGSALPVGVALSPDGRTAFVALMGRDQVAVVDLGRLAVERWIDVGSVPDGIAYVANAPAGLGAARD